MPGLMTQPTTPAEVYIDSRLRDEPPETAAERARHAYQIFHPQRLSEELAGAEEAFEAELARRQEEAAAPPAVEQEPEVPTLDAMETDARQRREALKERRQRLSLDATRDEAACLALSEVEADIEATETEIERIDLARHEAERRAPLEAAEREEKAKLVVAAEKQAARLPAAAKAVDVAAEAFAKTVATHRQLARRARELREEAGIQRPAPFGFTGSDSAYELALRHALGQHDVGDVVERPPSSFGHAPASPLAEPDMRERARAA
jgi:hypothetical protein